MVKQERIIVVFNTAIDHTDWRASCMAGGMSGAQLDAFRKDTDCSDDSGGKCVIAARASAWPSIALTKARDSATAGDATLSEGADWINWKANSSWADVVVG